MGHCKECGANLLGRIDKKFCSDGCRNAYHNRISRDENIEIRKINRILAKNHKVLKDFFDNDVKECPKERLAEQGFNFLYFTSLEKRSGGEKCFLCYDFGYYYTEMDIIYITQEN